MEKVCCLKYSSASAYITIIMGYLHQVALVFRGNRLDMSNNSGVHYLFCFHCVAQTGEMPPLNTLYVWSSGTPSRGLPISASLEFIDATN